MYRKPERGIAQRYPSAQAPDKVGQFIPYLKEGAFLAEVR